jgi:hypothetical protein
VDRAAEAYRGRGEEAEIAGAAGWRDGGGLVDGGRWSTAESDGERNATAVAR